MCDEESECRTVTSTKNRLFPPVGVDQVLGLLKIIHTLGGRIDVMHINEAVDADLGELSHAIDAAEMLGLIKYSQGDVELTEEGRRAVEMPLKYTQIALRNRLASIEPFAQLVNYLKKAEEVDVDEALQYIAGFGYGEGSAGRILDWAVFVQLVEIDNNKLKLDVSIEEI